MIPNKLISHQEILGGVRGKPAQLHPDLVPFSTRETTGDCDASLVTGYLESVASPYLASTPFCPSILPAILDYHSAVPYYG